MDIFEVAKNLKTIEEFCEFCLDIRESVKCSYKNCNFNLYNASLKDVLGSNKCYHYQVVCFISQSMKHPNAFKIMFNIQKLVKEKVKNSIDQVEKNYYACIIPVILCNFF